MPIWSPGRHIPTQKIPKCPPPPPPPGSSAVVMPQSKFTELCSSAAVLSQSKFTSCEARQPLCYKVNLPRYEARRRHLTMTCDIFGTGQTNTLTLCYLLGKTYKSAHSSATLEALKSTRSTKLLEKLLT